MFRGLQIALMAVLFLGGLLQASPTEAQRQQTGLDYSKVIQSTVYILTAVDCEYDAKTRRNPMGIPSVDTMFNTCQSGWNGSGTILDDEGTILTNSHVALEGVFPTAKPLWNLVFLTSDARSEPTPAFFAVAETYDPVLDLAIIKPAYSLDGQRLGRRDIAGFGLEPLPIAQEPVSIGDELINIGYPGIGGSLITLTSGRVAGFEPDLSNPQLGNDGWIKTDATLGGGISGGTTINASGALVGVPTEIGGFEERPLGQGGGNIVVGQINHIRPVSAGLPELFNRAQAAGQPLPTGVLVDRPTGSAPDVEIDAEEAPAIVDAGDAPDGAGAEEPGTVVDTGAETIVSGTVVSANTSLPIPEAYIVVLFPDATVRDFFRSDFDPALVYTIGVTDADGFFMIESSLVAGFGYSYLVAADGYDPVFGDDIILAPREAGDDFELPTIVLHESVI